MNFNAFALVLYSGHFCFQCAINARFLSSCPNHVALAWNTVQNPTGSATRMNRKASANSCLVTTSAYKVRWSLVVVVGDGAPGWSLVDVGSGGGGRAGRGKLGGGGWLPWSVVGVAGAT